MSDSGSSESEEFYDASDAAPANLSRRSTKRKSGSRGSDPRPVHLPRDGEVQLSAGGVVPVSPPAPSTPPQHTSPQQENVETQIQILTGNELSGRDQRWSRLERMRRGMDQDEEGDSSHNTTTTPPDSTESSVEGIYVSGVRSLHPFKVVDYDSRSVVSETRSAASRSLSGAGQHEAVELRSSGARAGPLTARNSEDIFLSPPPAATKFPPVFQLDPNDSVASPVENSHDFVDDDKGVGGETWESTAASEKPDRQDRTDAFAPYLVPDIVSSTNPGGEAMVEPAPNAAPPSVVGTPLPGALHPVAPPRRKKSKTRHGRAPPGSQARTEATSPRPTDLPVQPQPSLVTPLPVVSVTSTSSQRDSSLPSPASTVAFLTRDLENTLAISPTTHNLESSVKDLNLAEACRGDFVVKPQDDERTKGTVAPLEERSLCAQDTNFCPDPGGIATSSEAVTTSPGGFRSLDHSPERGLPRKSSTKSMGVRGGSGGHRTEGGSGGHRTGGSGGHHSGGSGGHHSGGSGGYRISGGRGSGGSDRRSTAGSVGSDSGYVKQMGMYLRTKTDSGKRLSDQEILQQIKVKNLDTGTEIDLAEAEEQLPESINPLSLHLMRLTSEYAVSGTRSMDSDTESMVSSMSDFEIGQGRKKQSIGRILGGVAKGATKAAKSISQEITRRQKSKEEKEEEKLGRLATDIVTTDGAQVNSTDGVRGTSGFKRIQAHKSGPYDFVGIQYGQDLSNHHCGPVWCMKFSLCGRLLATAGQDCILRIWVLRDKYDYFADMRARYMAEEAASNPADQLLAEESTLCYLNSPESQGHIFMDRPFITYTGHTSDLLDVSWSKNFFILTSSMDKTVRLWHISRKECLCCFQHIDFVTAIAFHPKNDQYFISGSLDGKIRLWNIPDKKVALWNEVDGATKLITAANFCQNGKFAAVGTYDGRCIFFSTDQLKYHTTIHVRSARGKNARGRKVTGIEPMPGEDKILITSNDSRIRLYDLRDTSLVCKYKGYTNLSSQIRASFSPDGKYICAGSENHCLFLWSTVLASSGLRKDRNNYYEAIRAHGAVVTCSTFAPAPELIQEAVRRGREAAGRAREDDDQDDKSQTYVVISGDFAGDIKIFINENKKS